MATFSKQAYIKLAETLKSAGVALITTASPEAIPATLHTIEIIKSRLISMLCRDNPSFDPEEFEFNSDPNNPDVD
jgi:hypothetical protein